MLLPLRLVWVEGHGHVTGGSGSYSPFPTADILWLLRPVPTSGLGGREGLSTHSQASAKGV